jgi:type IV secretion system protein VirD4
MNSRTLLIIYFILLLAGLSAGTQWVGYRLAYHPDLSPGIHIGPDGGGTVLYPPWAIVGWALRLGSAIPRALNEGYEIVGGSFLLATLMLALLRRTGQSIHVRELGKERWGTARDMKAAGLLTGKGVVLGQFRRWWLTYDGPEHQLVSGASRSGKGVGHVIPTLLNWTGSILVYDVKNELWDITAGFRSTFSHCAFFNPTRPDSIRFNPLFEIRKGPNEIRDTQNIVEMLINPTGTKQTMDIWDQQSSQFLVALILHVLYTEPDNCKNLATVRARLLDFKPTCRAMASLPHRFNPATGAPQVHPEIALVAKELLNQPEKFQASVRGTAASYLTLWADDLVARNTSTSDFRLSDLVCATRPMTLYLQPPPSDASRLRPLTRLIVNQTCRALMEYLATDSLHRPKRHRLLLLLDEFPTLGRLDFFTMNLRQMAGYGIKAHLIVQSFNDVIEQYGVNNTILDNCHILTAFASADTTTCQRTSAMTGTVTEYRESYSRPGRHWGMTGRTVSHSEQVRPLLSPGDVRQLSMDDQLVFVTGFKPMRVKKLRYFLDTCLKKRLLPPPDQSKAMDLPEGPAIAWLRERAKGGPIVLPLPRVVAHTSGASSEQAKERDREQEIDDDEAEDSQDAYEGVS